MFGLGAFEIAIIAFLALVFIGPKKLPELAKSMGKFFREFQDAVHGLNQPHQPQETTSPSEENATQQVDAQAEQPSTSEQNETKTTVSNDGGSSQDS